MPPDKNIWFWVFVGVVLLFALYRPGLFRFVYGQLRYRIQSTIVERVESHNGGKTWFAVHDRIWSFRKNRTKIIGFADEVYPGFSFRFGATMEVLKYFQAKGFFLGSNLSDLSLSIEERWDSKTKKLTRIVRVKRQTTVRPGVKNSNKANVTQ